MNNLDLLHKHFPAWKFKYTWEGAHWSGSEDSISGSLYLGGVFHLELVAIIGADGANIRKKNEAYRVTAYRFKGALTSQFKLAVIRYARVGHIGFNECRALLRTIACE